MRSRKASAAAVALPTAGLLLLAGAIYYQHTATDGPLALQTSTTQDPNVFQVYGVPHDGDTFRVDITLATRSGHVMPQPPMSQSVRILGINTPEVSPTKSPPDCMGTQAQTRLRELLTGQQVTLQSDPEQPTEDRYGRWLRFVDLAGGDVAEDLLQGGYAMVETQYPNSRTGRYLQVQDQAKDRRMGGWGACGWAADG